MKKMKKRGAVGVIIGILVLLLFLPFSPSAASSQLSFVFFLAALGAIIIELWMLAPALAPVWKITVGRLFKHPFAKFVTKKAIFYLIVAFIAFNAIFIIPRLMPGNPVDQLLPPNIPSGERERLRNVLMGYYGFDKPIYEQYVNFWANLLRGDLGPGIVSPYTFVPVMNVVMSRLPYTLALVIPVLLISFFVGNWIGAKAAYSKSRLSNAVYFTSVFGNILPFYWLAVVLLFLLAATAKIFPTYGTFSFMRIPGWNLETFIDLLQHYALPFLTLLIVSIGGWATGMRAMTLYELDSGYILYARQLGFRNNKLVSYAKRNAILPQFTGLIINLNNLIGMTMIIEIVFGWKGIGLLTYDAVQAADYSLIMGTFIITMVVVIFGNFLVDIVYAFIDPRIRTGQEG